MLDISGIFAIIGPKRHVYIGHDVRIRNTLGKHHQALMCSEHPLSVMQRHWDKNPDTFKFVVVEECEPLLSTLLRRASDAEKRYRYNGYTLYSEVEPGVAEGVKIVVPYGVHSGRLGRIIDIDSARNSVIVEIFIRGRAFTQEFPHSVIKPLVEKNSTTKQCQQQNRQAPVDWHESVAAANKRREALRHLREVD